ncbi:MAG: AMP-binding protein [Parvibaculum sp.]
MALISFWKKSERDTALSRILGHVEQTPHRLFARIVVNGEATAISYSALAASAAPYAAACQAQGIEKGDRVIILFDHGPELIFSFFGAMFAGAVPTMMSPPSPRQEPGHFWAGQRQVIQRIGAKAIMTTDRLRAALESVMPHHGTRIITPRELPTTDQIPDVDFAAHDIAFLQHSSGTTGTKKGVMISHEALLHQVDAYAKALEITQNDRIVSWLPLYHDMGFIACFLLPVIKGVPVTLLSPFEWVIRPTMLFDYFDKTKATLTWQPNFGFQHLVNCTKSDDRWDLSSMRAFVNCSERCRPETIDGFVSAFVDMGVSKGSMLTCYAMAETVFAATQSEPGIAPRVETIDTAALVDEGIARPTLATHSPTMQVQSCGKKIDGLNVLIMDEEGNRLPDRRIGEVCISGPSLSRGYDQQPEKTEAVFREGWYHSGDLGYLANGELFVTGRKDDLLILNGRNHYAHDLEFCLRDVPGIIPGRLMAMSDYRPEIGSDALIILAETRETNPAGVKLIKKSVRDAIVDETGLVPNEVHLLEPMWLLKSTSGKIARAANRQKFSELQEASI